MELWILVIIVSILIVLHYFGFSKIPASCKSAKAEKSNELAIIKDLRHQIEVIEDANAKTIEHIFNDKNPFALVSDSQWNFDHFAVPSVLLNSSKIVVEANTQFYKNFNGRQINVDIKGYSLERLFPFFDNDFQTIVEKTEYVLDTGQIEIVDTLELIERTVILYRVYISRCKINGRNYALLQFIRFPVSPRKIIDYDDKVTLGILKDSCRPILLVDTENNIIDINYAAIRYFKSHGIMTFNKKLYHMYPSLGTTEALDEAASKNRIEKLFTGYKTHVEIHVHKIVLHVGTYYLIVVLDIDNAKESSNFISSAEESHSKNDTSNVSEVVSA